MTDQNVTPAETTAKPDPYAEIAAALYRIADDLVALTGSGLPRPAYIQLSIQPGKHGDDDLSRRAVDAVSSALLGHPGQVSEMGSGTFHYDNGPGPERVGPVAVQVLQRVSTEWAVKHDVAAAEAELAEREAEWKKARARVIELRGQRADDGMGFSREPESTVAAPVPAGVEGHPEFGRTAGLAPVSVSEPVTRYFSFGHGQTDPVSGKNLLNHYVTVVATTAEECREAMFASRFGNRWAFEYIPGTPQADEWIAQWTEHERIDATSLRAGEHGRITNPDLAQFLAGKEHKRREAAYFLGLAESAKHYPAGGA